MKCLMWPVLDLDVYIVHVVIFIKKFSKLVQDKDFCDLLKILIMITFQGLFLEKHNFSESVMCYCEMFYLATFGPYIGVCIVHVVIFTIKFFLVKFLIISFYEWSKSTTIKILNFL